MKRAVPPTSDEAGGTAPDKSVEPTYPLRARLLAAVGPIGAGDDDGRAVARPAREPSWELVTLADRLVQRVDAVGDQHLGVVRDGLGQRVVGLGLVLSGLDRLLRDAGLSDLRLQRVDLLLSRRVVVEHGDVERLDADLVTNRGLHLLKRLLAQYRQLWRRGVAVSVDGQRVVALEHVVEHRLQVLVDQGIPDVGELAVVAVQLVDSRLVDLPLDVHVGTGHDLMRDAHLDAARSVLVALVVGVGLDGTVHQVDALPRRDEVCAVGEVPGGGAEGRRDADVLGGHRRERAEERADEREDDRTTADVAEEARLHQARTARHAVVVVVVVAAR